MAASQRLLPVAVSPRTHGLGHPAVVRARTSWHHHRPLTGVLLTSPAIAAAARGAETSTPVKPRHDQFERLLVLGSTGHCRPSAVIRGSPNLPDTQAPAHRGSCPGSSPSRLPGLGHRRPVAPRSKYLPQRAREGQVSGDESELVVGPIRPIAGRTTTACRQRKLGLTFNSGYGGPSFYNLST